MPSKKVLSVLILAAATVTAIIIAFGRDQASSAINHATDLIAGEAVTVPENPDWQNELGSIAGTAETFADPTGGETPGKETVTETVSRSLMANYMALKQAGSLDSESAQKLIDQTVNYIGNYSGLKLETPELNVIPDNGKQSITDYGERLGTIARAKKPADLQKEIGVVLRFIQSSDASKSAELDAVISSYEKIGEELVQMPVPQTFVKAHTDITRGALGIALALKEVKNLSQDPLKGLAALQLYQESVSLLSKATQATTAFILKNNIVYKQGSGGYYLLYGI